MRSRFFRQTGRSAFKTSEVLALFIISLFFGMFFFLLCAAIDYVIKSVFGAGS